MQDYLDASFEFNEIDDPCPNTIYGESKNSLHIELNKSIKPGKAWLGKSFDMVLTKMIKFCSYLIKSCINKNKFPVIVLF